MRPPLDDRSIRILRENVPEFENNYLDLVDIYDEDLTPQVVFNELADFVTELVQNGDCEETIERCFAALELVAVAPGADGTGLVAFCFLDQLPSFALEAIRGYLEPVTETILELVEQDLLYEDDGETALLLSDRLSPALGAGPDEKCVPAEKYVPAEKQVPVKKQVAAKEQVPVKKQVAAKEQVPAED